MNIYTKSVTFSLIALSALFVTAYSVNAQTNGSDDIVPPAISSNISNGSDDEVASGSTAAITSNGNDDSVIVPASDTTSSSSNGGSRSSKKTVKPVLTDVSNCLYINDYLKASWPNKAEEVTKLQTFLKDTEKLDVDINGKFDQKTFDAVSAFQTKYVDDVMSPWGVKTPTGQVFITTKKKINEIYCKSTFTLSPEQLAQIESYKKGIKTPSVVESIGTSTIDVSEVGINPDLSQSAAVVNASFGSRILTFIKWLFGY